MSVGACDAADHAYASSALLNPQLRMFIVKRLPQANTQMLCRKPVLCYSNMMLKVMAIRRTSRQRLQ
jgi:hypothetical protein